MKTIVDPRQIYQDSAVRGATPIELVVLLYDAAIEDMRRASAAMRQGDIEARSAQVGHALMVLQQLQGTLDFEHGGAAAKQFEQFYNLIRAKLLEAQIRHSPDLMQQQIRFMSEVRDGWIQAERQWQLRQNAAALAPAEVAGEDGGPSEWNA
ncbi:MAG: flagellar export chaperone FliS [Candidatus Korobacteraceae bacterium]